MTDFVPDIEVLREARKRLEIEDEWGRGDLVLYPEQNEAGEDLGPVKYCALGRIQQIIAEQGSYYFHDEEPQREVDEGYFVWLQPFCLELFGVSNITSINDDTTWGREYVIQVFEKAIVSLEEQGF